MRLETIGDGPAGQRDLVASPVILILVEAQTTVVAQLYELTVLAIINVIDPGMIGPNSRVGQLRKRDVGGM